MYPYIMTTLYYVVDIWIGYHNETSTLRVEKKNQMSKLQYYEALKYEVQFQVFPLIVLFIDSIRKWILGVVFRVLFNEIRGSRVKVE